MPHTVVKSYQNQNYEQIRQKCLSRDELFFDSKFAADETSIYRNADAASSNSNIISDGRNIVWKRPNEFLANPVFILRDSIDWSNIVQGDLGNW